MESLSTLHHSKATPRITSSVRYPRKRGNECICRQIRPKTKTYGMPISLTNRVMVCAGISNLGAENYWKAVYSSLDLGMGHETTVFLCSQDQTRGYKKYYRSLTRVKIKRVSDKNAKVKTFDGETKNRRRKRNELRCRSRYRIFRHTPYPHPKGREW